MWIWRRIKSIGWTGREANGEVLNINMIRCWQWNCLGHSLRGDSILRTAIGRTPSGGGNDDGDGDYDDNEDDGWWCRIKWCDAILLCQVDLEFRRQWDKLVISLDVIDREDESGSEAVHWITHYPVRRRRNADLTSNYQWFTFVFLCIINSPTLHCWFWLTIRFDWSFSVMCSILWSLVGMYNCTSTVDL